MSGPGQAALYTPEQRIRRDLSPWTKVQGVLAPLQFLVMIASTLLVIHSMRTGEAALWADGSVVLKTLLLYAIMVTGSLWEKDVFGEYLFAGPFFWEDVVSMGVILLHTAYLVALFGGAAGELRWTIALVAYAAYVVNAGQFLWKFRLARRGGPAAPATAEGPR